MAGLYDEVNKITEQMEGKKTEDLLVEILDTLKEMNENIKKIEYRSSVIANRPRSCLRCGSVIEHDMEKCPYCGMPVDKM